MQGTIALVGSGEYLPPMEPVDRWLLQCVPGTPHVVCLPTAAGPEGPARINYWMDLGVQHFQRLGAEAEGVPVTDRASADAPDCAERIRRANFVYLSGGKPNYLYNTLAGTAVWAAILEVLNRRSITASKLRPRAVDPASPAFTDHRQRWRHHLGILRTGALLHGGGAVVALTVVRRSVLLHRE